MRSTGGVARRGGGSGARIGSRAQRLTAALVFLALVAGACADDEVSRVSSSLQVEQVIQFGPVSLGRQRTARLKLANVGRAPMRIEGIRLEQPAPRDFTLGAPPAIVLAPGDTTEVIVAFAPVALGTRAARALVPTDSERTPLASVELWGEGVLGKAELGTRKLDFGKVAVQTVSSLPLPLQNQTKNPAEVLVPKPDGDDAEAFATAPQGPLTVPPNQRLDIEVSFRPGRIGLHNATVQVQPCPTCAVETVELVGEGIAAVLVADPDKVDFGFVSPGTSTEREVKLTNLGTEELTLEPLSLGGSSAAEFAFDPPVKIKLKQDESTTVKVRYSPTALDSKEGTLRVPWHTASCGANGATCSTVVIPLKGFGGGPDIDVRPPSMSFPKTGVGLVVEKGVSVRNVGNDPNNQKPLVVTSIRLKEKNPANPSEGNPGAFTLRFAAPMDWEPSQARPWTLNAGRNVGFYIVYSPQFASEGDEAVVEIRSNDGDEDPLLIPVKASSKDLGPCDYTVVPSRLDFGSVSRGQKARLAFVVRNMGANPCGVANVRLSRTTPPQFQMANISSRIINPGEELYVPVDFLPDQAQPYSGMVQFDTTSAQAPQGQVPLVARGVDACLEVKPQQLEFGTVGLACQPPTKSVAVRNACQMPVTVNRSYIGTGTSEEFELAAGQGGTVQLQPGQETTLSVTYQPTNEGPDTAPLYVDTSMGPVPYLVSLNGTGKLRPTQTDTFVQPPLNMVDFLFVIDNSGSLMEEQEAISRNFDAFIRTAVNNAVDFHIAVTTTGLTPYKGGWSDCPGGVDGGEAGRFFPVDGSRARILTPTTQNLRDTFSQNVKVGVCHWWEEGLEASKLALSPPLITSVDAPNFPEPNDGNAGFLRPEANLYVLYVTDEDDSDTTDVNGYVEFFKGLKPGRPDLVTASAIVGLPSCPTAPSVGTRYIQVVNALGGLIADICSPDWGGIMQKIGEDAFTPRTVFPLSQMPDGRDITVSIDGNEIAKTAGNGSAQWHFDPTIGDYGAVVFDNGHAPGPNTTLEISYPVPCP